MNDEGTAVLSLTDEYGRSYTAWADSKKLKGATIYGKDYDEPIATYENKTVTLAELTKDLGIVGDDALNLYENGSNSGKATTTFTNDGSSLGGFGSVVEIYKVAANSYKVVVINTYVAVVGTIGKDDTTVTLTAKNESAQTRVTATASVEGLTKGDIVSFNMGATVNKISAYNVTKLEGTAVKVTASGTDKDGAYVRVDGEKVYASKMVSKDATTASTTATIANVKTGTFYYDSYGNVLYYENTTANVNKPVDGYFLLEAINASEGDSTNTLLDTSAAQAKVKVDDLATGEQSVVSLAVANYDKGLSADYKWYFADNTGAAVTDADHEVTPSKAASLYATDTVYGYYKMDDGTYVLEKLADISAANLANTSGWVSGTDVIANKGEATVKGAADVFADANTKLTVLSPKAAPAVGYSATTVTGIANFPKVVFTTGDKVFYVTGANSRITEVVVILANAVTDNEVDTNTYAMYQGDGDIATDDNGTAISWDYNFVLNKEVVTYTSTTNLNTKLKSDNLNKVFKITTDGKFDATLVTDTVTGTVQQITDSYIVVYATDHNVVVYLADNVQYGASAPNLSEMTVGSSVIVYNGTQTKVTAEYIVVTGDPT
jgi:hypothetical protein